MLVIAREQVRAIRACRREDLPAVASLYEAVMRSGGRTAPPGLAGYFERTVFDCPWADPEIPSLVYEDRGAIVGFIGSHVRRMRLDGQPARFAFGGQLVADPGARSRAVGALLLRAYLKGPQEATFTDGANDPVRRMWEMSGGESAHLKTLRWTRVLRPLRYGGGHALERLGRERLARGVAPLLGALDPLALRLARRRFALGERKTASKPLGAHAALVAARPAAKMLRCHPDYDERYLAWVFREMAAVTSRGRFVRSLVLDGAGEAIGWYLYYLRGGLAEVFQVAAKPGAAGEVLDELFHHAAEAGAAAVSGRLEPQLADALAARKCLYRWSGTALLHARTQALAGVVLSGRCWLGLMDGESWMGHHREAFA